MFSSGSESDSDFFISSGRAAEEKELTLATIPALDMRRLAAPVSATLLAYHQHLAERNALDFPDLLYRTRAMLALLPEKRAKWSARFQWIQMDEVQDTHVSEYENELTNRAALARNLDLLATDDATSSSVPTGPTTGATTIFKHRCGGSANVTGNSGEIRLARRSKKWNIAA